MGKNKMGNRASRVRARVETIEANLAHNKNELKILSSYLHELQQDTPSDLRVLNEQMCGLQEKQQANKTYQVKVEHSLEKICIDMKNLGEKVNSLQEKVANLSSEQKKVQEMVPHVINDIIANETHSWEVSVSDLNEKYESMQTSYNELCENTKHHETEIEELNEKFKGLAIQNSERRLVSSCKCRGNFEEQEGMSENTSLDVEEPPKSTFCYDVNLVKIKNVMRRIKDDMEVEDI